MNVQEKLLHYEAALIAAPRRILAGKDDWKKDITRDAGVYVIWEAGVARYVGETSALRARMRDLTSVKNHSFAKGTCDRFGIDASDKEGLVKVYSSNYELSFCAIPLGRKEVEEYLILRWRSSLWNKVTSRLLVGHQYNWVVPAASTSENEAGGTTAIQALQSNPAKEFDTELAEEL